MGVVGVIRRATIALDFEFCQYECGSRGSYELTFNRLLHKITS